MRNLILIIFLLLITNSVFSQKEYRKFRETMNGLTCNDPNAVSNAKVNIPILEKHIENHPEHYNAYYDLAMEYYTLAVSDSVNKTFYITKCVETNEHYIAIAPKKMKHRGYWNNAIMRGWAKDCEKALSDLEMAWILTPRKMKKYWDETSAQLTRDKCK